MAATRTNKFKQFLLLFDAVKSAASNEPERVKTFFSQSEKLSTAVFQIFFFLNFGDFERRVFHSSKKYHVQIPENFEQIFNEYKSNWEDIIIGVVIPVLARHVDVDLDDSDLETLKNFSLPVPRHPDPETEDGFDPLKHDGAEALDMAFWATISSWESLESNQDTINYASKIGLEAYDYLTDTIGLDVEGVFRRWRKIPIIFMPAHVSNKHGMTERGSLFELIDDAVRAYVFGAPAAAIAACRAVLEMILKHHYDLDYQYTSSDGRKLDKGLTELIIMAEKRYEYVQGTRLRRLTQDANRIMHSYNRRGRLSEADESIILNFLKSIKFLAERAPHSSK